VTALGLLTNSCYGEPMTLRVLALSTLFPDMTRPNFGVFVERQYRELASRDGVEVTMVAPVGIAPWPLSRHRHYAPLAALPREERWRNLSVHRPRFTVIPRLGRLVHHCQHDARGVAAWCVRCTQQNHSM
jgi:hypothetical protein